MLANIRKRKAEEAFGEKKIITMNVFQGNLNLKQV
jgi:hypothetical protein